MLKIEGEKNEFEAMSEEAQTYKERVLTDIMNVENSEAREALARKYAKELGTTHEVLLQAAEGQEDVLDAAIWERAVS